MVYFLPIFLPVYPDEGRSAASLLENNYLAKQLLVT